MAPRDKTTASEAAAVLVPANDKGRSLPIWIARGAGWIEGATLTDAQRAWVEAAGFNGSGNRHLLIPGSDGALAGVAFGIGETRDPMARPEIMLGLLAGLLPPGRYHLEGSVENADLAAVAWGLGSYRFRRYKTGGKPGSAEVPPQLRSPDGADPARA